MAYFSSISFVFCTLWWCFQRTINKGSKVSFLTIANLTVHHCVYIFHVYFPYDHTLHFSTLNLICCFSLCNVMS